MLSFPFFGRPARRTALRRLGGAALAGFCLSGALAFAPAPAAAANMALARIAEFAHTTGYAPKSALVKASDGLWYGAAGLGGQFKDGVVYRVSAAGNYEVVHVFDFGGSRGFDNSDQFSALTEGPGGQLYGTAIVGDWAHGHHGLLYQLGLDGQYTVLHYFGDGGAGDGIQPLGAPVLAGDGSLYGVTSFGGAHSAGSVYRYTPGVGLSILYSFGSVSTDGRSPQSLTLGPDGALYGTTLNGPGKDLGALFKMSLAGEFTSLHAVPENRRQGVFPLGLVTGPDGFLYGVAPGLVSGPKGNFQGLVFRMSTAGDYSVLAGFPDGGAAGTQPIWALSFDTDGALLLTTFGGGKGDGGVALRLTMAGEKQVLHAFDRFDPNAPQRPLGGLAALGEGSYIGTNSLGGRNRGEGGVVFTLTPR
jgi:uncharacterized repeat protein (TIGR03803 family)